MACFSLMLVVMLIIDITGDIDALRRNHDMVVEAGGTCVMVGINSIGQAIAVSHDYFNDHYLIPVLAGAPPLGRYTLFGQHFARMQDTVYRLDRHPTIPQPSQGKRHRAI